MTCYRPANHFLPAAVVAFALAVFAGWCGLSWKPAFIPGVLFLISSALLAFLASRPAIVIRERSWSVGNKNFLWSDVERVEAGAWNSPLVVKITFRGGKGFRLIYPGESASSGQLLRQMRRLARGARLSGPQFWQPADDDATPPKYRLLSPEDEAEVERLYQRLRTSSEERHE